MTMKKVEIRIVKNGYLIRVGLQDEDDSDYCLEYEEYIHKTIEEALFRVKFALEGGPSVEA